MFILLILMSRMAQTYLPTFPMVVGGDDLPVRIVVVGHWVRQQFSRYFVLFEGFEQCATCIKVINY